MQSWAADCFVRFWVDGLPVARSGWIFGFTSRLVNKSCPGDRTLSMFDGFPSNIWNNILDWNRKSPTLCVVLEILHIYILTSLWTILCASGNIGTRGPQQLHSLWSWCLAKWSWSFTDMFADTSRHCSFGWPAPQKVTCYLWENHYVVFSLQNTAPWETTVPSRRGSNLFVNWRSEIKRLLICAYFGLVN